MQYRVISDNTECLDNNTPPYQPVFISLCLMAKDRAICIKGHKHFQLIH